MTLIIAFLCISKETNLYYSELQLIGLEQCLQKPTNHAVRSWSFYSPSSSNIKESRFK